jgi:hypothetical protein
MSEKPGLHLDPAIEQIRADLLAFMGETYVSSNANASYDGSGVNFGITAEDPQRNRWTYSEYASGFRITVSPVSASLHAGQTQQFTGSATNPGGQPVPGAQFDWSVLAGAVGTISASGLYQAPAAVAAPATDSIRCSLKGQGQPAWAMVMVTVQP